MAKTSKSALKRLRTSTKSRIANKACKSTLKTVEKKFRTAVAAADAVKAEEIMKDCISRCDKAAKTGIIHKNKASNKKSQLMSLFNGLKK